MPSRSSNTAASAPSELDNLFQKELSVANDDRRRKAALSTVRNLRPSNRLTVQDFFVSLEKHPDLWSVVSTLGIQEFAALLSGQPTVDAVPAAGKRTRLTEEQKTALKAVCLRLLEAHRLGLSRTELAGYIQTEGLKPAGVRDAELADKLRIPLAELVDTNQAHTVGEKRLMKYVAGAKRR